MAPPILYLTLGYPGSGKTHFSVKFSHKNKLFHLNADQLRLEIFENPTYSPEEHKIVFRVMDYIAEELLSNGVSVIYDANLNKKFHRLKKYKIAKKSGADAVLLWFKTSPDTAMGRISNRSDGVDKKYIDVTPETFFRLKSELEEPLAERYIEVDGTTTYTNQEAQVMLNLKTKEP